MIANRSANPLLIRRMSTVAEQLRLAREAKNLSVQQVAEATKIRSDHVRALDEGNYDVFSAQVYIKGFVRTYATYLKLDVPKLMDLLETELSRTARHHEHPPLPQSRGVLDYLMYQLSKLNWRIVLPVLAVGLILLCAFVIVRFWSSRKTRDPLAGIGPGLYQPVKTNSALDLVLPLPQPQRK